MCFYTKQTKKATQLETRFKATFVERNEYVMGDFSGFTHPLFPVITNDAPDKIQLFEWGLIPHWAKDRSIQKNTLNARMDTLREKPAFRDVLKQRCLVLADGFYEWQWLDDKGKSKQKYMIGLPDDQLFAFAGLWSKWVDPKNGEIVHSFTIITTEANELMSTIHNTKKRMPVIVHKDIEQEWLQGVKGIMQNDDLIATPIL